MANLHWKIVYENVIFKDCKFQGYEQIRTVTSFIRQSLELREGDSSQS